MKGKVLLVVTRLAQPDHFDITAYIQSCSSPNWEAREAIGEAFWCCSWGTVPLPISTERLAVGETIRFTTRYDLSFSEGYDGEWDSQLELTKPRVLRRQGGRR